MPVLRTINSKSGTPFDDGTNLPVDENLSSSEARAGLIQIATQTETNTGTNNTKAVTPLTLKTAVNANTFIQQSTDYQKGVIQISNNSQTDGGLDNLTAISPYQLNRRIVAFPVATTTLAGKIQIATNAETTTGTDPNKAVTPASLANRLSSFTIPGAAPTGSVVDFAGATPPTGYLICDGASYSTTTFAGLFAVIGYTYGGSGASFNVPDCRGRVSIGTGTGTGLTARVLAQIFGAETHLLTTAEIPAHNHVATATVYTGILADPLATNSLSGYLTSQRTKSLISMVSTANTGGGASHNITQPSIVFNKIIKT